MRQRLELTNAGWIWSGFEELTGELSQEGSLGLQRVALQALSFAGQADCRKIDGGSNILLAGRIEHIADKAMIAIGAQGSLGSLRGNKRSASSP